MLPKLHEYSKIVLSLRLVAVYGLTVESLATLLVGGVTIQALSTTFHTVPTPEGIYLFRAGRY